jgi:DNA-binding NarL/FixJ family response regulator
LIHSGARTHFAAIFESLWATTEAASPGGAGGSGAYPTEAEARLLRLLADGLTYQAIARRMGVSSRTIE